MRFVLFICGTLISVVASAMCSFNGILPLSKSSTLNKNGLIILEFYSLSQDLIPGLNKKYPIYLQSLRGRVNLFVIEALTGEFSITQVVFKPESALNPGDTYELRIDSLSSHQPPPQQFDPTSKIWKPLTYTITEYTDLEFPLFTCAPLLTKKAYTRYGCGPAQIVQFQLAGYDKSEVFVRTTVKSKTTGKTSVYLLPIENGCVEVGHAMCSGAFRFRDGNDYEVSFQLFDQSGNRGESTSGIAFTKPDPQKDMVGN